MSLDSDNERQILNKVYSCQEGCFLYLRDEETSPRPTFLDFIQNTIQSALQKYLNKKLWRVENLAFKNPDTFELNMKYSEILPSGLQSAISSEDFGSGIIIFALTPSMDEDSASQLWIRVVQSKMENLSPDTELFGTWETFSITGDSNILVWTNSSLSTKEIKRVALDSDYQLLEDEITIQAYNR
ncbi:hypothetical protein FO519_000464 [Halicephalobus sp. NKZ332]|nr:hypothetical protein FO519_000464 [Halicephalobus sp. NKZ332]